MEHEFEKIAVEIGQDALAAAARAWLDREFEIAERDPARYLKPALRPLALAAAVGASVTAELVLARAALWKTTGALAVQAEFSHQVCCELMDRLAELDQAKARIAELEKRLAYAELVARINTEAAALR